MKKIYFILFVLALFFVCSCQNGDLAVDPEPEKMGDTELSETQAKAVLMSFIKDLEKNNPQTRGQGIVIKSVNKEYTQDIATRAGNSPKIAIYNMELQCGNESNFAIVLGDTRRPLVMAYARGEYSKINTSENDGLKEYVNTIPQMARMLLADTIIYPDQNDHYTGFGESPAPDYSWGGDYFNSWTDEYGTAHDAVFLHEDILWTQSAPYNGKLEYANLYERIPVGCANLAIAQILAYYRYPAKYNWDIITDGITLSNEDTEEKAEAVTSLIKDIFDATQSYYNTTTHETATSMDNAYLALQTFGYCFSAYGYWDLNAIKASLDRSHPIMMSSQTKSVPPTFKAKGHAYVVRGYWKFLLTNMNSQDYAMSLAINWGWGGFGDGWYMVQYESMDINSIGLWPITLDNQGNIQANDNYGNYFQYFLDLRPDYMPE